MNYQPAQPPKLSGNPIEAMAARIQGLPADIRWLHAVPDVIQSRACGTRLILGARTRLAAALMSLAVVPSLARLAACGGSLVLLVLVYWSQSRSRTRSALHPSIFVGVGALRERALIEELTKERSGPVSVFNETTLRSFYDTERVRWRDLWREWRSVLRSAWSQLGGQENSVGVPPLNRRIEFLTKGHRYAYLRAWFRLIWAHHQEREPIVFSAASVVSFAAIAVGIKSAYHLHGFQRQSLVYPDFDEVRCFTEVEAAHISRRLPAARVTVRSEACSPIHTKRVVAIAGCYGQSLGLDGCAAFIAAAKENECPVVIRPHPLDKSGFFDRWHTDNNVTFCDTSDSFDAFLEQHRPRMLLSWFSTALYDALRRGVVPVTVETETWRPGDTVFPFREISLHWPEERARALALLSNDGDREAFLAERRTIAGIASER